MYFTGMLKNWVQGVHKKSSETSCCDTSFASQALLGGCLGVLPALQGNCPSREAAVDWDSLKMMRCELRCLLRAFIA